MKGDGMGDNRIRAKSRGESTRRRNDLLAPFSFPCSLRFRSFSSLALSLLIYMSDVVAFSSYILPYLIWFLAGGDTVTHTHRILDGHVCSYHVTPVMLSHLDADRYISQWIFNNVHQTLRMERTADGQCAVTEAKSWQKAIILTFESFRKLVQGT